MDFLSGIAGQDLGWLGTVASLLIAGAFLPAVITIIVNLLRLPVLRQTVEASCFSAGKLISALATKRLGSVGQKLEDGLQEVKNLANDAFDRGLDADDR